MATLFDTLRAQAKPFENKVKTLLNHDLKTICKEEGLQVSGVKSVLQGRVIQRLDDAVQSGDAPRLQDICRRINRFGSQSSNPTVTTNIRSSAPQQPRATTSNSSSSAGYYPYTDQNVTRFPTLQQFPGHVSAMFKTSPFYNVKDHLTGIVQMPIASSTRHTSHATLSLNQGQAELFTRSPAVRAMVYCWIDYEQAPRDITFPGQIEIKANGEVFQGNLKGIKKKAGTTKPADITHLLRLQPHHSNQISIAYAQTDKKFSFVVCLVKKVSVEELVERIKQGHSISKQHVINEMINKAKDPDIVATSSVMSLKCPLSAARMELPCRSTLCTHNQCFDATTFLQVQEQAPQWSCPVCNKVFNFKALVVDQYVKDILQSTPKFVEQVTIEPNGTWKQGTQPDEEFRVPSSSAKRKTTDSFDLDAESSIDPFDLRLNGIRAESVSTPHSYARTPTFSSREPSTSASTVPPRSNSKRPADNVIDLTLSDDDEEDLPPQRPAKRKSTGNFPFSSNSPQYQSNGYIPSPSYPPQQQLHQQQPQQQQQQQQRPQHLPPPHSQTFSPPLHFDSGQSRFSMNMSQKQSPDQPQQTYHSLAFHDGYGGFAPSAWQ